MRFDVLTLFPAMVEGPLRSSILGRALEAGSFELGVHDIRAHGLGRHHVVDDTPYGGGSGMVMRVDVVDAAIASEEQTVTRARRRKRCLMVTMNMKPAQVASRSLGLPGAEQADDCPHPDQSRHGELLPVEHPSGYRRNEHE